MVNRYLVSLPGGHRNERARDTKTLGRGDDIMNADDAEVSSCAVKLYEDS